MDLLIEMIVNGILALFGVGQEKKQLPPATERPDDSSQGGSPRNPNQRPIPKPDYTNSQAPLQRAQELLRKLQASQQQAARQRLGPPTNPRQLANRNAFLQRRPQQQPFPRQGMQPPRPPALPTNLNPPTPPEKVVEVGDIEAQKDAYRAVDPRVRPLAISAAGLSTLFRTRPDSLRSAFVLSEILSKPLALKDPPR